MPHAFEEHWSRDVDHCPYGASAGHRRSCACADQALSDLHRRADGALEAIGAPLWVLDDVRTGAVLDDITGDPSLELLLAWVGVSEREPPRKLRLSYDGHVLDFTGATRFGSWHVSARAVGPEQANLALMLARPSAVGPAVRSPGHLALTVHPQVRSVVLTLFRSYARTPAPHAYPVDWANAADLLAQVTRLHADLSAPVWAALAAISAHGWKASLADLVTAATGTMAAPELD